MLLFDHRLDFVVGCSSAEIINEFGDIVGVAIVFVVVSGYCDGAGI